MKKTALELSNTLLITISIQQQSQLIRMSDQFIKSVTTTFKKLSSCNQFSFIFKYSLKALYIILNNDENNDYVLFVDSGNNHDIHNFWESEHRNYSQSSVKNWVSHKQQLYQYAYVAGNIHTFLSSILVIYENKILHQ